MKTKNDMAAIYHTTIDIICYFITYSIMFYFIYLDCKNIAQTIFISLFILIFGNILLFLPLLIPIGISYMIKFGSIAAFPIYLFFLIGDIFGDNNFINISYFEGLLLSIGLSLFGFLNIKSWKKALGNECYLTEHFLNAID
jgi:hypothetical protein